MLSSSSVSLDCGQIYGPHSHGPSPTQFELGGGGLHVSEQRGASDETLDLAAIRRVLLELELLELTIIELELPESSSFSSGQMYGPHPHGPWPMHSLLGGAAH